MKFISQKKGTILIFLTLIYPIHGISQENYRIIHEQSSITIQGTSSLHDWEMGVTDMDCYTSLIKEGNRLKGINNTWFSCRSRSIISDYKLMDKKTYDALKADEHPHITFRLTSVKELSPLPHEFNGVIMGELVIAGYAREVVVPFNGKFLENDRVYFEGSVPLSMSDFDIAPPTALLGTLKTGDQIRILYSLNLVKVTQNEKELTGKIQY